MGRAFSFSPFSLLMDYRAVCKSSRSHSSQGTCRRWEHTSLITLYCSLTKQSLILLQRKKMEMTETTLTHPFPNFNSGLRH